MEVRNKVVVITGGSRGIGRATAEIFAGEKARLVLVSRNKEEIKKAAKEVARFGGEVLGIAGDVREADETQAMVEAAMVRFGRIDILINNAGIAEWKDFLALTKEEWNRVIDVNLRGVLNCIYAAAPLMVKQKDGVIVNISSGAGKAGHPGLATYSATKFGILGFTQAFAQEVAIDNVRVYAVCPGATKTAMTGFKGIAVEKVAKRVFETAAESLGLSSGEETEVYE